MTPTCVNITINLLEAIAAAFDDCKTVDGCKCVVFEVRNSLLHKQREQRAVRESEVANLVRRKEKSA